MSRKKTRAPKTTGERQVPIFGGRKTGVLVTDRQGRQMVMTFADLAAVVMSSIDESIVAGIGASYDFVFSDTDAVMTD